MTTVVTTNVTTDVMTENVTTNVTTDVMTENVTTNVTSKCFVYLLAFLLLLFSFSQLSMNNE